MGFKIELRNPFKRSVSKKSNNIRNTFGDILGKLSGITLQATKEIAEKRGEITRLEIEADGLEQLLESNQKIVKVVSGLLGDNNTNDPNPPASNQGAEPRMRIG